MKCHQQYCFSCLHLPHQWNFHYFSHIPHPSHLKKQIDRKTTLIKKHQCFSPLKTQVQARNPFPSKRKTTSNPHLPRLQQNNCALTMKSRVAKDKEDSKYLKMLFGYTGPKFLTEFEEMKPRIFGSLPLRVLLWLNWKKREDKGE